MFKFDMTDFQRFAVSSVGAIAVSAACLLAAAGPARAESPAAPVSAAAWQKQVQQQIESSSQDLSMLDGTTQVKNVTLAARFTADGDYAGAEMARSSGNARLDRRAAQIVAHVAYPALPAAYRGQPTTVTMRLFFGTDAAKVAEAVKQTPVQFAFTTNAGGAGQRMTAR